MAEKKPQKKGAGRHAGTGNVTIDLGEEIDKKLRAAVGADRPSYRPGGYRPGQYRPGMFGGYRPWYASSHGGRWNLGDKLGLPETMVTSQALTGALLGIVGSRALLRVTPEVIASSSRLAHEAIAFAVGLVPLLIKRNSMTMGVALPGFVFLGGALVDWGLDSVGVRRPVLSGGARSGQDAALSARQKLEALRGRMANPPQGSLPRVVAQPSYA